MFLDHFANSGSHRNPQIAQYFIHDIHVHVSTRWHLKTAHAYFLVNQLHSHTITFNLEIKENIAV